MNQTILIITGIFLGALSWIVCPLVSDRFEPFDTGTGLFIGKSIMLLFTVYVGWVRNIKSVFVAVLGIYIGQNAYAYLFGGSEAAAWAALLLITSIFLCIIPLVGGLAARGIHVYWTRHAANS